MTFVEIESKRRPCSFLSNNVKNDVDTARFYLSLVSFAGVRQSVRQSMEMEEEEEEEEKKKDFSTCLNISAFADGELGTRR